MRITGERERREKGDKKRGKRKIEIRERLSIIHSFKGCQLPPFHCITPYI